MVESSFLVIHLLLVLLLVLLLPAVATARKLQQCDTCTPPITFNPTVHKPVYKIWSQRLLNNAYMATFNTTFQDYLTATAGKRFDPPIKFELSLDRDGNLAYDFLQAEEIDFVLVNPFQGSCLEAEFSTEPLVSTIRRTSFGGTKMALAHFGGMFITHVDNHDINAVEDIEGKVTAAVSASSLGGTFVQWHEMQKNGMDYLNDPAAVVFTDSMIKTVNGVIDKSFEVGFIRTRFLESLKNRNPNLNVSAIKVVGVRKDEGTVDESFPLERSTTILPEWKFSAASHTPPDVSQEVQAALLAFETHGNTGLDRAACLLDTNVNNTEPCDDLTSIDPHALCEATVESVTAAASVVSTKDHNIFRTPLAFNRIRKLALDLGAIQEDPTSDSLRCYRPSNFYNQINCPNGLYKLPEEALLSSCNSTSFVCPDGMTCLCKPCFEALPIEVAPLADYSAGSGCTKMSICSTIKQNEVIEYTLVDNQKQDGGRNLLAKTLEDGIDTEIVIEKGPVPHTYSFSLSTPRVGIFILEIYDGEVQIDASPLRVRVEYRDCASDKQANEAGVCKCKAAFVDIFGRCVPIWLAVIVALSPLLVIGGIFLYFFVKKKERQANSLWIVQRSDLKFSDPPAVLGHGSFGYVLQAQYRGSKVAVKRALPPSRGKSGSTESVIFGPTRKFSSRDGSVPLVGSSVHKKSSDSTQSVDLEAGDNGSDPSRGRNSVGATQGNKNSRKARQAFMEEMRVLSTLRHPNITTLMGAVIDGSDPMLVMEYMEHGSLYEVLRNPTILLESDLILHIVKDIAQGVRFLHSSNPPLIHGDLKSGNILIDSKFRAKLADFGMVKRRQKVATGTPLWMAPELFNNAFNTPKSDMYSVGVILNEIVSRNEPYHDSEDDLSVILKGVRDPKLNRRPEIPSYCPVKVKKLIMFLWHADPKLRPTASELNNRLDDLNDQVFAACVPASHRTPSAALSAVDHGDFLYQAFPRHVADVLRSGGKVEPEPHNDVSICFSDIVGFTTIASKLDPLKVSNMLDRLYLKFDEITKKHDLFKVETVGDAYMCAGNLAKDQHEDHVRRIALFATGIREAASETLIDEEDPSLGYTKVRVGFHSGPVVSNVVGSLNPRFGVFGDTVNIASRIETTSKEGKIQCSEICAKRLMDDAPDMMVKKRGATEIKGRGKMTTYWVSSL